MSDFPKMLYRPYENNAPAAAVVYSDVPCQTIVVANADEQSIASKDGYVEAAKVGVKPAPKKRAVKANDDKA